MSRSPNNRSIKSDDKDVAANSNKMTKNDNKCGKCNKSVRDNDNGLLCDSCDVWYHNGCIKISMEEYKIWENSDHPQGVLTENSSFQTCNLEGIVGTWDLIPINTAFQLKVYNYWLIAN